MDEKSPLPQCIYCGYEDSKHNEVCTVSALRRQLYLTGMSPGAAENIVNLIAALIAGRLHYERRRAVSAIGDERG